MILFNKTPKGYVLTDSEGRFVVLKSDKEAVEALSALASQSNLRSEINWAGTWMVLPRAEYESLMGF